MTHQRIFLSVVIIVAVLAVLIGLVAVMGASARVPSYALKVRAYDKSTSAQVVEGVVLEQKKGKVNVLGDKTNFRFETRTKAYNKAGKQTTQKSFLNSVVADPVVGDVVSITGERRSDGTFEVDKIVNRSR